MAKQRHERTLARRMAVQVLYQSEITAASVTQIAAEDVPVPDGGPLPDYAVQLLQGIEAHREEIDKRLAQASENWSVDRMPIVDRAVMRMAVYEMLFEDQVPVSVAINEAVELAKSFGGEDDSARFANGILGNIARALPAQEQKAASGDE